MPSSGGLDIQAMMQAAMAAVGQQNGYQQPQSPQGTITAGAISGSNYQLPWEDPAFSVSAGLSGKYQRVYWGTDSGHPSTPGHKPLVDKETGAIYAGKMTGGGTPGTSGRGDKVLTVQEALNQPATWDAAQIKSAIAKMQAAGYVGVNDFQTMDAVWKRLVYRSAASYGTVNADGSPQAKLTPWDVLSLDQRLGLQADGTQMQLGVSGGRFTGQRTTDVTKTVNDLDKGAVWSKISDAMTQLMGRAPTDRELRDFSYRMNQMAAADPQITKTITDYQNGVRQGSQSEIVQAGFSPSTSLMKEDLQQQATNYAKAQPDYGAYQAAVPLYNAAIQAVGAIP
jgi:hypothetical protein